MIRLGINEGINSSLVVASDAEIVFAIQEERISRIKNFMGFPCESVRFALRHLGLSPGEVKFVCRANNQSPAHSRREFLAWYDDTADVLERPLVERMLKSTTGSVYRRLPASLQRIGRSVVDRHGNRILVEMLRECGLDKAELVSAHHHLNHAATAYFGLRTNARDAHLVMTLDGEGDGDCAHVYAAKDGRLQLLAATPAGHSVGNLYSRVTHLMGLRPHEDEHKLMGLGAYASDERYIKPIAARLFEYLDLDPSNPLRFKCKVPEGTSFIQPRLAHDFKRVRFDHLAAGLQQYTESMLVNWTKAAIERTGIRAVVCAGGVFMNIKANRRIAELPELTFFDVFPSCGDESLPFGAVWRHYAATSQTGGEEICFRGCCLGPEPDYDLDQAIRAYADQVDFVEVSDPIATVAKMLSEGKIVARCAGRMEFGARALGNRSILADPADQRVVAEINKTIKHRDFWMPFAPAIQYEDASIYIKIPPSLPAGRISPYMMHSFQTTDRRDEFVAGIHGYDGTTRAQVVVREISPELHRIIVEFSRIRGRSVILNTSFNRHGDPIVMGARDAIEVLLGSSLKYLMLGNLLVTKRKAT